MPKFRVTRTIHNAHEFVVIAKDLTEAYFKADELFESSPGAFEVSFSDVRDANEITPSEMLNEVYIKVEKRKADLALIDLDKAAAPKTAVKPQSSCTSHSQSSLSAKPAVKPAQPKVVKKVPQRKPATPVAPVAAPAALKEV